MLGELEMFGVKSATVYYGQFFVSLKICGQAVSKTYYPIMEIL